MKIDFSWSLEDWKAVFDRFLALVSNFFAALGIKLFPDSPDYSDWDDFTISTKKPGSDDE